MNLDNAEGKITISKPSGGGIDHDNEYVEIALIDSTSGIEFVSTRILMADFARALMGLSHVEMRFDFHPSLVGKTYEHKTLIVPFERRYAKESERIKIAAETLAPFEIDGWKGRVGDLFNGHRYTKNGQSVTFTRYVDSQPCDEGER